MIKHILAQSLFILIAVFSFGPLTVSAGFFGDTETSLQQQFTATELQLESGISETSFELGAMQTEQSTTLNAITSALSITADFDIAVVGVSGSVDFCNNINLQVVSSTTDLTSALPEFTTAALEEFGSFDLTFSLADTSAVVTSDECVATLAVTTWQKNMSKESAGYRDTVEYEITITDSEIVLNEVSAPPSTLLTSQALIDLSVKNSEPLQTSDVLTDTATGSTATDTADATESVQIPASATTTNKSVNQESPEPATSDSEVVTTTTQKEESDEPESVPADQQSESGVESKPEAKPSVGEVNNTEPEESTEAEQPEPVIKETEPEVTEEEVVESAG